MATTSDDIVFRLSAELSNFNKGMESGAKSVKRLEDRMAATARNIQRALVALGVGLVAREFVQLADKATNLAARIRLVAGSAENAAKVQAELLAVANRTRVDFESVVTLYARLGRSADELGVSQSRLIAFTETFSQALKISGSSTAEANATVIQLSQALASGYLRGAELNSILEQGGRAAIALAQGLGVPIGELKKLGEQGQLTAQKVIAAIESQASVIKREFSQMPQTVGDALTVLQNRLLEFVGRVDRTSASSRALAEAIGDLGKIFDDPDFAAAVTEALRGLVNVVWIAVAGVKQLHMWMKQLGDLANEFTGREWANPAPTSEQRNARAKHASRGGFVLPGVEFPEAKAVGLGGGGGGDDGSKAAIRDAERYGDVIQDLRFEMEQLGRSESEAAYQQELRNRLSAAGVTLESDRGRAIEELTAQLHSMTEAHEAEALMWEVEAAQANRAIAEINEGLRKEAEAWIELGEHAKEALADALVDIAFDAKNAKEIVAQLIVEIGRAIAKMLILKAIEAGVDAAFGGGGTVGGKALGGSIHPGNAYQLHKNEIVIPRVPMSVIPANRAGGGATVNYAPVFNVAPGATKQDVLAAVQAWDAKIRRDIVPIVTDARRRGGMRDFH